MRQAEWIECESPPAETIEDLVVIAEHTENDEHGSEQYIQYFAHPSGEFILSRIPIGGGWSWSIAKIDRRSSPGPSKVGWKL